MCIEFEEPNQDRKFDKSVSVDYVRVAKVNQGAQNQEYKAEKGCIISQNPKTQLPTNALNFGKRATTL